MPIYCYTSKLMRKTIERAYPMGEAPDTVMVGDISYKRNPVAQVSGQIAIVKGSSNRVKRTWPMQPCLASGVHEDDAPELRKHFKKHGLNIEVNRDGDPIYESAAQRKKALKCRGLFDKASF